jgi:hypothetical protein
MEHDTQAIIIKLMAEKIQELQDDLEATQHSRLLWISYHDKAQEELKRLRKKRGPGRPKGSTTKVRK